MKSKEKKQPEFASNNLGQPKVFTNGITWPTGKPSSHQSDFTQGDFQNALKKASRKGSAHAPVRSDEEEK
jgi:hypothetical protein